MRAYDRLFIGGEWVAAAGSETIEVISPHTEEVIGRAPEGGPADIDRAVAAARAAFDDGPWPRLDPGDRAALVGRIAGGYAGREADMRRLLAAELGSPVADGVQTGLAHATWRHFADADRAADRKSVV